MCDSTHSGVEVVSMQHALASYYSRGDTLRSRSVSEIVLTGTLDIAAPSAHLMADWQRDIALQLQLAPGDVEPLSLARARPRWPDYRVCVRAVDGWLSALGLHELLASSEIALMACRGARYHHDGDRYGGSAFCNLFLNEDSGLDLHFPGTGLRIPLVRGTVVLFDTGQPHAVIPRGSAGFEATDFPPGPAHTQIFLSWELPIEHVPLAHVLGIAFDTDPANALLLKDEQVWWNGAAASLCPATGRWLPADAVLP